MAMSDMGQRLKVEGGKSKVGVVSGGLALGGVVKECEEAPNCGDGNVERPEEFDHVGVTDDILIATDDMGSGAENGRLQEQVVVGITAHLHVAGHRDEPGYAGDDADKGISLGAGRTPNPHDPGPGQNVV